MKSIISTCQGETFRAAAQSPWSGTILLVTHGGWYLEMERGDILLLHDVRFGEIPIGAALPDIGELPYAKRFEHQPLRFENGTLMLTGELQIELRGEKETRQHETVGVSQKRLRELEKALRNSGRGELRYAACGLQPPEDSPLWREMQRRTEGFLAAAGGGYEEISAAVKELLGLGRGLTPACDDWLAGYMYAARRTGKTEACAAVSKAVLEYAGEYTNAVSAAYLRAAARGEYYELLEDCLFGEDADSIARLLSIGSSSGSDMLSGMIAVCND